MLQAGGFMPLGQQSALAVQPQSPLTGLFSTEEFCFVLFPCFVCFPQSFFILNPSEDSAHWTKMPFLFLHCFHLFQPHVADKWSLHPQGERLTPHFTSSCPEFSCPNFFLFAPPCTFTAPQGSCEKTLHSREPPNFMLSFVYITYGPNLSHKASWYKAHKFILCITS